MNRFISLQNHLKTTPKTQNKIFSNRIHTINHNSNFFKPINVQNTQNFTFQPVFLNETPQIWTKFTPIDNAVEFIEKQQEETLFSTSLFTTSQIMTKEETGLEMFKLDNEMIIEKSEKMITMNIINPNELSEEVENYECDSVMKKRRKKMNKHKHRKMLKKQRFLLRRQGRK